jgi:hypothetical protein
MDQGENNENRKKKNRLLPIIWLGGTGLTGALIVLGMLYMRKQGEVNNLIKQLNDTTSVFNREKEAVDAELAQVTTSYDSLMTGYGLLENNLAEQKNKNRRLVKENAGIALLLKGSMEDNTALQGTAEQLRAENETLRNEGEALRTQSNALQADVANRDSVIYEQMAMLGIQDDRLKNDSASMARMIDSINHENRSGYFNSTELNGAYGLARVDIPYSHYFYGLTTVNGYAVNRHLFTGIGLGLLQYDTSGLTFPIYLDFRYHFGKSGFNPYIYTDCGVIFKNGESMNYPMVFFNPGIGFCKNLSDRFGLNVGAGIMMQRDEMKSSFVNLKIGFVFLENGGMKPWVSSR